MKTLRWNILLKYDAVLKRTHNLCFLAEIRNLMLPLYTVLYCIKVGFKEGQNYIGVFSWWIYLSGNRQDHLMK